MIVPVALALAALFLVLLVARAIKQLGSVLGRQLGAGPKGGDWDAWPEDIRVREFPAVERGAAA